ncbi:SIMPL domain-containing protein [Synechococcus elongatus]|uniref:SIMPL domain-containing protein n=1 Tax=Synechococcus elongatus TaxID=32046 RepID=UPI000F7E8BA8|nr:SIMPL domain-containing protein [Synechococcus elongatus]
MLSQQRPWHWLALTTAALLVLPGPAVTEPSPQRLITVTGQGRESVAAKLLEVNLGVEVQAATAEAAQAEVSRRADSLVKLLRDRRVEQLTTTGITLSPRYRYRDNQQIPDGFTATYSLQFRSPSNAAGSVIDAAIKSGSTRIDSIRFVATGPELETAQATALREAAADARQKADIVLRSLGLSAQEIQTIQVNSAAAPGPVPQLRTAVADSAANVPIVGGEQDVTASVTLQIRY